MPHETILRPPFRVVIADDHSLFRQGLKSLLKLQSDVEVVGEAETLADLPSILADIGCDLLLLDLGMERNSIVDISALAERVQVIVVTACEQPHDAAEAVRLGARAVVFKRYAVDTLMTAIHAVAEGHIWTPPIVQAALVEDFHDPTNRRLTSREREVIRNVAFGFRNSEVARRLFISEKTVKTHLNHIFEKLGIRDRVELALYAARTGIIGIHERPL